MHQMQAIIFSHPASGEAQRELERVDVFRTGTVLFQERGVWLLCLWKAGEGRYWTWKSVVLKSQREEVAWVKLKITLESFPPPPLPKARVKEPECMRGTVFGNHLQKCLFDLEVAWSPLDIWHCMCVGIRWLSYPGQILRCRGKKERKYIGQGSKARE